MKLKRFQEHVDNIEKQYIKFNSNEIKYMKAKGALTKYEDDYYLNGRIIEKLVNGNYLVVYANIECSTIQSLNKYTYLSVQEVIDIIKDIFEKSEIHQNTKTKFWRYKGKDWATQHIQFLKSYIYLNDLTYDIIEMCKKYNIIDDELMIIINKLIYNEA